MTGQENPSETWDEVREQLKKKILFPGEEIQYTPDHTFYKNVHYMLCHRQSVSKESKVRVCLTNFRLIIIEGSLEDKIRTASGVRNVNDGVYFFDDIVLKNIEKIKYTLDKRCQERHTVTNNALPTSGGITSLQVYCRNFTLLDIRARRNDQTLGDKSLVSRLKSFRLLPRRSQANSVSYEELKKMLRYLIGCKHTEFYTKYANSMEGLAKTGGVPSYRKISDYESELDHLKTPKIWCINEDANRGFKYQSLPEILLCPNDAVSKKLDLNMLLAAYREKRYPVPCWYYQTNDVYLLRSASEDHGLRENCNEMEGRIFGIIKDPNKQKPFKTIELANRFPNYLATVWQRIYTDNGIVRVGNVIQPKELSSGYNNLKYHCLKGSDRKYWNSDKDWFASLAATQWPNFIRVCLFIATKIADKLHYGAVSILVKDYDGAELSCVICSLVQVILDGDCRTIKGFQTLLQKNWVVVGYRFNASQESPFFELFLSCISQLLYQNPLAFEFSPNYISHLLDISLCGLTETFSYNNEYERCRYNYVRKGEGNVSKRTGIVLPSAWNLCYLNWKEVFNERYIMNQVLQRIYGKTIAKPLTVVTDIFDMKIWHSLYLRSFGMHDEGSIRNYEIQHQSERSYNESILCLLEKTRALGCLKYTNGRIIDVIDYKKLSQLYTYNEHVRHRQYPKTSASDVRNVSQSFSGFPSSTYNTDVYTVSHDIPRDPSMPYIATRSGQYRTNESAIYSSSASFCNEHPLSNNTWINQTRYPEIAKSSVRNVDAYPDVSMASPYNGSRHADAKIKETANTGKYTVGQPKSRSTSLRNDFYFSHQEEYSPRNDGNYYQPADHNYNEYVNMQNFAKQYGHSPRIAYQKMKSNETNF
ncbi:uncharacterized protein TRIADDRAFT_54716 [Trichoplax adhaerens]|uniref:Myotubularin phosphatase domain-containing protein n=1 Tax=Trichoplax adhaerens TaxID=10228 RepID=B3RSS9_TRIAD|nr:hypothetical protein TRIADDRAFT_54716 [Trichoplax adhaerens]EDV26578.1 hypothetical protein TRIADDRAFT_54716 [Trichoplax adhaerens]|eukprot:XP_002110574.1 hypothetical protein TRIADDRAFT_54716 [Trichoplax adhaerens]